MAMKDLDALLLLGGQGTRLRSVISDKPKPLAEVGGRPFLDILLEHAASSGLERFILCTGYRAAAVRSFIQDHLRRGEFVFSEEDRPLGTGGAVKQAEPWIRSDPFFVFNGDSYCAADLVGFLDFFLGRGALISMVLAETKTSDDFGSVEMDRSGRILSFREKAGAPTAWINAGIYLFSKNVLEAIPAGTPCSLEKEIFPKLTRREFFGFPTKEALIDIGTPERLASAQRHVFGRRP